MSQEKLCKECHIEKFFKYPWIVVGVITIITVFFAAQLPRARLDNNTTGFLPDNVPAKIVTQHLEETYGDDVMVLVGLERPYGTVFEREFLTRVREFTTWVETLEFVKEASSIMSTDYITADGESIVVTDLVPADFSGAKEEIAELKRRIASWDLYQGSLISDDLSATEVVLTLTVPSSESGSPEVAACLITIRDTAKEMFDRLATVYTTGEPVINAVMNEAMGTDVAFLIPLVIIVVLAVLVFSFHRLTYVTLPLLTVIVGVVWALGAMPLFGVKLTILSVVLPIILIAVDTAYGIHVVSHYRDEITDKTFTVEEHRAIVLSMMRRLIKPVFLAALTTFAGFLSFCFTSLYPIRDFGIFSAFGVIASFVVSVTLVPAILLIRGPRAVKLQNKRAALEAFRARQGGDKHAKAGREGGALVTALEAVARRRALVLATAALAIVVSVYGLSKVIVDNAMVDFFNDNSEIARSDRFVREHFGGSKQITVSVEADSTEILLSPRTLVAVDSLSTYLTERVPLVGKVTGFTDMVKRMNQMFNVDEPPEGVRVTTRDTDSADDGGDGFGDFGGFGEFDDVDTSGVIDGDVGFGFTFDDAPGVVSAAPAALPVAFISQGHAPVYANYTVPELLDFLDTASGKHANMSGSELSRELKRVTNYDGYSYYEIPSDPARYGKETDEELRQIISNYLVLLAGDADQSFSNDPFEPTAIKTTIQIRSPWQEDVQTVVDEVTAYTAANFPGDVRVVIGGGAMQEGALTELTMNSQLISIFVSVLMVLLIVAISHKSLAAGLIAALPLTIGVLANFAIMGFLGIKLNMGTALIGSLVVGIGIDYTIHFIEFYKNEYAAGGDFLRRTYAGCGKAILINALSVGLGFGVLAFSQFKNCAQLGFLIMVSMIINAIVSLTVIPALLMTAKPAFVYGKK